MNWKQFKLRLVTVLVVCFFPSNILAAQAEIQGDYCYQYGDSESLMAAKEISYAMALRKAIETYKTFVASTSVVQDFQFRKDLVETIASGYVENVKIIKQEVQGRTVCTELIGYVNPATVESIIARKVEKKKQIRSKQSEGLISNSKVKILNYKRMLCNQGPCVEILYEARVQLDGTNPWLRQTIIVECFDSNGELIPGTNSEIPRYPDGAVHKGAVRGTYILLPEGTASFELRLAGS